MHAFAARSTFRSQHVKHTRGSDHFWTFRCRFAWQAHGVVHLVKNEQNVKVLWQFQKRGAGVGHLKKICKDAFSDIFRGRRNTRDMCIRAVRRSGR